jgi:hypothetical protein
MSTNFIYLRPCRSSSGQSRGGPGSRPRAACGVCGGQAALGQVFSEYFGFTSQLSFHQILHHHTHLGPPQYAYWWPQYRVDPIGLHRPLYKFKIVYLPIALQSFVWALAVHSVSLSFYTVGRTPWTGISLSQGRYLHTGKQKPRVNAQASMQVRFEPMIPVFERAKTVHALPRGHCDRPTNFID